MGRGAKRCIKCKAYLGFTGRTLCVKCGNHNTKAKAAVRQWVKEQKRLKNASQDKRG